MLLSTGAATADPCPQADWPTGYRATQGTHFHDPGMYHLLDLPERHMFVCVFIYVHVGVCMHLDTIIYTYIKIHFFH